MTEDATPAIEIVDGVRVGWDEARAANLANWNDRAELHVDAYGLDALRDDPARLSQVVRTDLAAMAPFLPATGLAGLDLVHLQCHIGSDTVSLARAGARVTGVDFSHVALAAAADLAHSLGIDATWIETDVLDARAAVDAAVGADAAFDVVYTSIGAIGWLHDLDRWAAQVAALLKPGGLFYIRDGHPMLYALDENEWPPRVRYRYFADGTAMRIDDARTYAGDGVVSHPRTYEYPHELAEIINVLLAHGLTVRRVEEGRTLPWRFCDAMVEREDGDFAFPGDYEAAIPCTFTVVATKP